MIMNKAYLLTGSNLGNREENITVAKTLIEIHCGGISRLSSVYETAAWGKTDQDAFLNQVLEIETSLKAIQLIRRILKIEKMIGRIRKEKYGPRLIDIDILLFNNEKHQFPLLTIPHPELQNRRFALVPLAEIAAEIMHPVLNKSVNELLQSCPDKLDVKKYR